MYLINVINKVKHLVKLRLEPRKKPQIVQFMLLATLLQFSFNANSIETAVVVSDNNKPYVLGIFPRKGFNETVHNFTPLANYLTKKLNKKVKLVAAKNFETFWKNVSTNKYDIVHFNQYHYIRSHKEFGYKVIAKNEENGSSTIAGVIITNKNSGIKSLSELKGKTIIFGGGPKAMQSYIVASYLLKKANLQKSDYTERFAPNPINAILAVFYGSVVAAGSADANLYVKNVKDRIDQSQMKILASGDDLAHLPWAVNKRLSEKDTNKIQHILTTLRDSSEGLSVLRIAELTDIRPVTDDKYNPHRVIVKSVLGESY